MADKAFTALVRGRVQGVGFRYHAQSEAAKYGLKGWVRNTAAGEVEVWAEGGETALEAFLSWLHSGPPWACVDGVTVTWQSPRGTDKSFQITT
ncbi:MAG: acylphosphatase [Spirochaetaceae bacterium]|jgi:acylphosphatase|nr:acylphosphatase [Spirochaetaceae bacterium]